MGYFRREKFKTSDSGEWFHIYHPTVMKKGAVFIANREDTFVKKILKRIK